MKSSKRFEQFINEKDVPLTRMRSSELEFGSERSKKKGHKSKKSNNWGHCKNSKRSMISS